MNNNNNNNNNRSRCPYPRLDWDTTKYCKDCKSISPFDKNNKCIICIDRNDNEYWRRRE